ncbi:MULTISPECIES: hypothetical protein [Candidatus Ichthyocystis]|uniref:hypothetical protein n=1 Tax=Candidatus Ichthyocystis TaxID=2929841 RepID=UPI000B895DBF|nr:MULTISPECIES: hypothetical protein [Ichthyocystis]
MVAVQKLTNLVIINREEPTLVGVSQDTKGKSKKSEKKSGNVGSSGVVGLSASLTSSSSSGLGENLGARPKVKHGGKGRKSNRKDNDIWHNPTRKSAKALKGQGQNLAATQECGDNNEGEGHAGLSLLRLGIGPRSKLGNRVREPGKIVSGGMSRSEFRGNMLLFFVLFFPY